MCIAACKACSLRLFPFVYHQNILTKAIHFALWQLVFDVLVIIFTAVTKFKVTGICVSDNISEMLHTALIKLSTK